MAGQGFAPAEQISITVDGAVAAAGVADGQGALASTPVTIPAGATVGWHAVVAIGASSGGSASAPFLVLGPLRGTVENLAFRSAALGGTIHVSVYLPAGYPTERARYPVIYFLHGLPARETAYRSRSAFVAAYLEALSLRAIVVVPQGSRAGDDDPEYLDWGPRRDWETAVSVELPRYVDAHFRTIASRRARALIGVSAGGYGAVLCGLHHLRTFSVLESWGGYFEPTDASGAHVLDLGSAAANERASGLALASRLRASFASEPTVLAFFVGQQDARFLADNMRFNSALIVARVPHHFVLYPGGHDPSFWASHAAQWIALAVQRLAAPQG